VHYFLLEINEEIKFRKENGLNLHTKLYLWTRRGALMFTKIINNNVGWNQYNRILDTLFEQMEWAGTQNQKIREEVDTGKNTGKLPEAIKQLPLPSQDKWYLRNTYKIERICKALDIEIKDFNHMVLMKIQEKYSMEAIGAAYKKQNGTVPKYAMDIIDCFSELGEIADEVLVGYMLSIVDKFALLKQITGNSVN